VRPALANIITARVPEADLLIDTMTVRPQGNRAFLISDTIRRLKAADIWAKLDVLWMLAAHDAQAARLNWKAPASFTLTAVNSPTFTADRGYAGNGTTSYLNTGWAPATNGIRYTQNDGVLGAWSRTARAGADMAIVGGWSSAAALTQIVNRFTDNNVYTRVNDVGGGPAVSASDGLFTVTRVSSGGTRTTYRNGASLGATSAASNANVSTQSLYICAQNAIGTASGFSTDQIAMVFLGGGLSAAEVASSYNILLGYINGIGA
jgi:hypothetical protein